jgi:alcohol dehydrogenase class IV
MLEFQFYQKAKMLFGQGTVKQAGELLEYMGAKKPFIVCDKGVLAAGIVDKVLDSLKEKKISYVIFDEVEPNPRLR